MEVINIGVNGPTELIEAFKKTVTRLHNLSIYSGRQSRYIRVSSDRRTGHDSSPCTDLHGFYTSRRNFLKALYDLPTQWQEALDAVDELLNPPAPNFEDLEVGTVFEIANVFNNRRVLLKVQPVKKSDPPAVSLMGHEHCPQQSQVWWQADVVRVLGKLDVDLMLAKAVK